MKNFIQSKSAGTPNYVGWIRSNLNFNVILGGEEQKTQNREVCIIVYSGFFSCSDSRQVK